MALERIPVAPLAPPCDLPERKEDVHLVHYCAASLSAFVIVRSTSPCPSADPACATSSMSSPEDMICTSSASSSACPVP
eukprot:CAMPEP_0180163982 /NCGR_PEP_ID=MMETSP0986-20121125/30115_1 /TAXON_ID=697907 /ORGANISM="non described non described, Strain CCMP2293" /LENGTH=78 /DNA_ID=CAMNT_0022114705 /DNA_START=296 /DNA_END=530 /DNA_ORIENTATION=-